MNYSRPDIKIIPDKTDKRLHIAGIILLIINLAFAVWLYFISPEIIPAHFDSSGKVNRYDHKEVIFILPVIMLFVYGLLSLVIKFPSVHNYPVKVTPENAESLYRRSIKLLRMLNIGLLILFGFIFFEMYRGIRDHFLPLTWWELPLILILCIGLPIFLSFRLFPVTKKTAL